MVRACREKTVVFIEPVGLAMLIFLSAYVFHFFLQEPTLRLLAVDKIYLFKQILLPNLASVLFP